MSNCKFRACKDFIHDMITYDYYKKEYVDLVTPEIRNMYNFFQDDDEGLKMYLESINFEQQINIENLVEYRYYNDVDEEEII